MQMFSFGSLLQTLYVEVSTKYKRKQCNLIQLLELPKLGKNQLHQNILFKQEDFGGKELWCTVYGSMTNYR
jgi:hypothetical protein